MALHKDGGRQPHLRGHGPPLATEVIELLAARAPRLDRVLRIITREGGHVVLIDGALIRTRDGAQ